MNGSGLSAIASSTAPDGRAGAMALIHAGGPGGGARAWELVEFLGAVDLTPADAELRFHQAAAFARLGLSTAARETLAALVSGRNGAAPAPWATLQRTVAAMPDDRVSLDERVRTAEANLAVLRARGIDLADAERAWRERTAIESWFRTRDGNIVRRDESGRWTLWGDELGRARACPMPKGVDGSEVAPFYLEGIDPPWLLRRVAEHATLRADGAWARIVLVQRDVGQFIDGLACADLRDVLAQPRLRVLLGENAGARLAQFLSDRLDQLIGGHRLTLKSTRRTIEPPMSRVIESACAAQQTEIARGMSAIGGRYAARDRAFWADRYARALDGSGSPLRVLIPTTRYSTFVQHSCRDLAEALTSLGCRAEVLIESEADAAISAVALIRAIERFDPDLVLQINYTRPRDSACIPAQVPLACWVQDAMPHLFDAARGSEQGELDFLVGHLHAEFFERFGYPRERALYSPVLVSPVKFHPGPVNAALAQRHACEIAYVSHQSETPEAACERIARQWTGDRAKAMAAATRALLAPLSGLMEAGLDQWLYQGVERAAEESVCAALGHEAPAEVLAKFRMAVAHPIAERMMRHRMLAWAAELCDERGWRLHLYGRGWAQHPTLARFAQGELPHGEDLRASYQCARLHLHASLGTLQHQRVLECALSGGLTAARFKRDDANYLSWWAMETIAATSGVRYEPWPAAHPTRWDVSKPCLVPIDAHEPARRSVEVRTRLGLPPTAHDAPPGWFYVAPTQQAKPWAARGGRAMSFDEALLIGDPVAAGFWSRETFRRAVSEAVTNPDHRAALARVQRERVLATSTYLAFVKDMLAFIAQRLRGTGRT